MSRNSSGAYTPPSGNPVTTRTSISSTWANTTINDIGAELTSSLDRNGRGPMLAPLALPPGSSSLPALTWALEPTTGLYRNASNDIRLAIASTDMQRWSSSGVLFPLGLTVTQSQSNVEGANVTGNGTAPGLVAVGGSSGGTGLRGTGSGTAAIGVEGYGTGNKQGGYFIGGSGNGDGSHSTGGGTGSSGSYCRGGISGAGVWGEGGAGGPGVVGVPGSGGTLAAKLKGIIDLSEAAALTGAPNADPGDKQLTYANILRAFVSFGTVNAAGAQTIKNSFNITSVVLEANKTDITVTWGFSMSAADSACISVGFTNISAAPHAAKVRFRNATTCTIQLYNTSTGALLDVTTFASGSFTVDVHVSGF